MATAILSPAFGRISGRFGDVVFRTIRGKTIVSRAPAKRPQATERQLAQQNRFREAAAYARYAIGNPPARDFYSALGRDRELTAYAAAVRDYLNPPVVDDIALALYQGHPEDEIIVHATDDAGVAGITVTIRDMTRSVVEKGPARLWDDVWIYDATTLAPPGRPLTIEVTAIDRPGNEVTRRLPWIPASSD